MSDSENTQNNNEETNPLRQLADGGDNTEVISIDEVITPTDEPTISSDETKASDVVPVVSENKTPASSSTGTTHNSKDSRGDSRDSGNRSAGGGKRNFRSRTPRRTEKVKPEFDQKIVSARRVTRVVAGGRRFSFSIALIIGDHNGKVGFGLGKANDTALAIQKALHQAKKNMIKVKLTDDRSIPFETESKNKSATVILRPNGGRGLVAGSASRIVLDMAGIHNVTAKVVSRTRNKINNTRATMDALAPFVIGRGLTIAPVIVPKVYIDEATIKDDDAVE